MATPLISICIPAYKNVDFIARLLESISMQTFKDYEVIITDDSEDDSVRSYIKSVQLNQLSYFRNAIPLKSPANWNAAISRAKGEWIKLMHDDDWFAAKNSLEKFADAAKATESNFIFSGFELVDLETAQRKKYVLASSDEYLLQRSPFSLFKKNVIGHPSTTLIRNDREEWYAERLKWVVDIEFYMRLLDEEDDFYVIREPLINIGISSIQITKSAFRNPAIEIPENLYLLKKLSPSALKNIIAYDYYWRLIRNLEIRDRKKMEEYAMGEEIPRIISTMIRHQRVIPLRTLKLGVISKLAMTCSYIFCRIANTFDK